MGDEVWIRRVHVLWRGSQLLLLEGGVKVRWVGQIGVVVVQRVGIGIALQHPEQAMRKHCRGGIKGVMVHIGMEAMVRW